jgi:hypothetical protein
MYQRIIRELRCTLILAGQYACLQYEAIENDAGVVLEQVIPAISALRQFIVIEATDCFMTDFSQSGSSTNVVPTPKVTGPEQNLPIRNFEPCK